MAPHHRRRSSRTCRPKVSDDNEDPTDVWFAIYGANVNVDENGDIIGVTDAQSVLGRYRSLCEAQGLDHSSVIVNGEH